MNNSAKEIIEVLTKAERPIICMDSRVDFDALCSAIIMRNFLMDICKREVRVTLDRELKDNIKKITGDYTDISFVEENVCPTTDIDFSKYDLLIFLDSGSMEHVCKDRNTIEANIKTINIDHHTGNTYFGNINYVKHYVSCTSVLFNLFEEAKIDWNKSLASVYYLGILLDGGFFQYNTVTAYDFYVAYKLVEAGAKNFEIAWKINFNEKLNDMKLKAIVYDNLVVVGRVAYSIVTLEQLEDRGVDYENSSVPVADMIKRLEGVDFVFVIRDRGKSVFDVSFRSHEMDYDVLKIAKEFGGGGHVMAAGATIKAGSFEEVVEKIFAKL